MYPGICQLPTPSSSSSSIIYIFTDLGLISSIIPSEPSSYLTLILINAPLSIRLSASDSVISPLIYFLKIYSPTPPSVSSYPSLVLKFIIQYTGVLVCTSGSSGSGVGSGVGSGCGSGSTGVGVGSGVGCGSGVGSGVGSTVPLSELPLSDCSGTSVLLSEVLSPTITLLSALLSSSLAVSTSLITSSDTFTSEVSELPVLSSAFSVLVSVVILISVPSAFTSVPASFTFTSVTVILSSLTFPLPVNVTLLPALSVTSISALPSAFSARGAGS